MKDENESRPKLGFTDKFLIVLFILIGSAFFAVIIAGVHDREIRDAQKSEPVKVEVVEDKPVRVQADYFNMAEPITINGWQLQELDTYRLSDIDSFDMETYKLVCEDGSEFLVVRTHNGLAVTQIIKEDK